MPQNTMNSEPFSKRIENVQFNKNNNDTFSPDLLDRSQNDCNNATNS